MSVFNTAESKNAFEQILQSREADILQNPQGFMRRHQKHERALGCRLLQYSILLDSKHVRTKLQSNRRLVKYLGNGQVNLIKLY